MQEQIKEKQKSGRKPKGGKEMHFILSAESVQVIEERAKDSETPTKTAVVEEALRRYDRELRLT